MGLKIAVKKTSTCDNYVDIVYWDSTSTSAAGTYVDGTGWYSINSDGDDFLTLIPWGIVPWESVWINGYQPKSARIFFTGPSTVDVYLLQREEESPDTLLVSQIGYSSGDVISIEGSYSSISTKLSSVTAVNSPGTGTIVVTSIILCF